MPPVSPAKTDGVLLFVEDLTKIVLESDLLQERDDRYELTAPLSTLPDSLTAPACTHLEHSIAPYAPRSGRGFSSPSVPVAMFIGAERPDERVVFYTPAPGTPTYIAFRNDRALSV
jgi:hypothetical protein